MRDADILDAFHERAAIREYDGCQPRELAEAEAVADVAKAAGMTTAEVRARIAAAAERRPML